MNQEPAIPHPPITVVLPVEHVHTLLNAVEYARSRGAYNDIGLSQVHVLSGVQLHVASLLPQPPTPQTPPTSV